MSDCISLFYVITSSHVAYYILRFHLDTYREFLHAKMPMQKSVLFSPTVNKYTNNDLTFEDPREYFRIYVKYLMEVFIL